MRFLKYVILLLPLLQAPSPAAGEEFRPEEYQPITLSFGGYQFGQGPAANMTCYSGYCKSQAPGGDGRVTVPFSIYETPGAVSTLPALTVVAPRYTFWEDRLFRIVFQVDCTPLDMPACLDEIVEALDREYDLRALSSSDVSHYFEEKRIIIREFQTESGAYVKIRGLIHKDKATMPWIDIVDRGMADLVGSSLSPAYKPPKRAPLIDLNRKP